MPQDRRQDHRKASLDVRAIADGAAARGHFDLGSLKGSFTPAELWPLFEELKRRGIPLEAPSQGRSRGGVEQGQQTGAGLDRGTALTIINALRTGTVPACDLTPLSVGREQVRKKLSTDLQRVAQHASRVRFLNAPYGSGKTHSLWLLADAAFSERFAVSVVTLSARDCPLHSLLSVYGAIVDGIRLGRGRKIHGLEALLERWMELLQQVGPTVAEQRVAELRHPLTTVLAEYAGATLNVVRPNEPRRMLILDYLSGRRRTMSDLRAIGAERSLTEDTALAMLKQITVLVRQLGLKGLCVFLDEAESVHSFSRSAQVDQAYDNLLRLVEAGTSLRNCYFIYAATPSFFGDYEYHWLSHRTIKSDEVYELPELTLGESLELAERLRRIYSDSYGGVPTEAQIHEVATALVDEAVGVSAFVRGIVAVMDKARRVA